jgi:hypothetical protein
MAERLGPALGQAGAPEPTRVQWFAQVGERGSGRTVEGLP